MILKDTLCLIKSTLKVSALPEKNYSFFHRVLVCYTVNKKVPFYSDEKSSWTKKLEAPLRKSSGIWTKKKKKEKVRSWFSLITWPICWCSFYLSFFLEIIQQRKDFACRVSLIIQMLIYIYIYIKNLGIKKKKEKKVMFVAAFLSSDTSH